MEYPMDGLLLVYSVCIYNVMSLAVDVLSIIVDSYAFYARRNEIEIKKCTYKYNIGDDNTQWADIDLQSLILLNIQKLQVLRPRLNWFLAN